MISPFDNLSQQSYILSLKTILNTFTHNYCKIIVIDRIPIGPLASLVTTISTPQLSPFQNNTLGHSCIYPIIRFPNISPNLNQIDHFLTTHDIPSIISYLRSNNYVIDSDLTNLISQSFNNSSQTICMFHFSN
tara:strand:+ start:1081 stop:1479 length:399 start_codon:yes stop_codon:yes gene_type:complete